MVLYNLNVYSYALRQITRLKKGTEPMLDCLLARLHRLQRECQRGDLAAFFELLELHNCLQQFKSTLLKRKKACESLKALHTLETPNRDLLPCESLQLPLGSAAHGTLAECIELMDAVFVALNQLAVCSEGAHHTAVSMQTGQLKKVCLHALLKLVFHARKERLHVGHYLQSSKEARPKLLKKRNIKINDFYQSIKRNDFGLLRENWQRKLLQISAEMPAEDVGY